MKNVNTLVRTGFTLAALAMVASGQHLTVCCAGTPSYSDSNYRLTGQVAVATMYAPGGTAGLLADRDLVIWNISSPPAPNTNWAPTDRYYSDPRWNYGNLGDVFGLTIDDQGNIYVAATTIYAKVPANARVGSLANSIFPPIARHGAIYKITNTTGTPTLFAQLPNPNGAGLGNITFDCSNKNHPSLYVSNFDDGLIYQLDLNSSGGVLSTKTWDHGAMRSTAKDGNTSASLNLANIPPATALDPQGYTRLGGRPFAVKAEWGRLYYSIWSEDSLHNPASGESLAFPNQIWSVDLNPTGVGFGTDLRLQVTLPVLNKFTDNWNNPVADLVFSYEPTPKMITAERTMGTSVFGNQARVLEFIEATMSPSTQTYQVGCVPGYTNSAGGVDVDYDSYSYPGQTIFDPGYRVWATGDKLRSDSKYTTGYVRGLQGFPILGGTVANSILIDLNNDAAEMSEVGDQVGDVRIPCSVNRTVNTTGGQ